MFKCVELKFPSLSIRRNFELFKNVFETLKIEVEHFLLFLKLELLLYLNYVKNWGFQLSTFKFYIYTTNLYTLWYFLDRSVNNKVIR